MKSKGIAFSDLFDPDVIGDGPTAPAYRVGGVPIRFADIKYGSKRADIGYAERGVDVSNKWAAKGTARYNDAVLGTFGPYRANSSSSHDTGASCTITFRPDGTFAVSMTALQGGSTSGTPRSGGWHKAPAAGVGSGYEIQFIASMGIDNTYVDSGGDSGVTPTYTATTGWLPLSSARTIAVDTSHLLGGSEGVRSGTVEVSGTYTVNIRRIGFPQVVATEIYIDVMAMI